MIWERLLFVRWPLAFCLVMVIGMGIWATLRLLRDGGSPRLETKVWIDAVGVWGFLAFLSGLLGASAGLILALQGAERAGTMASPQAARGLVVATLGPTLGTTVFGVAVIVWFVLQLRWRLGRARSED